MKNFNLIIGALLIAFVWISCDESSDETAKRQRQEENALFNDYIDSLKITYPDLEPDSSGIYYIDYKEGVGDSIKNMDEVHIYYLAMHCDSVDFESNLQNDDNYLYVVDDFNFDDIEKNFVDAHYYDPKKIVVGTRSVVAGLDIALLNMKEGGVAQVVIPENLGYGSSRTSGVRPYATLVYFVKVDKVYPVETDE